MRLGIDLDGVLVDNYSVWTAYYKEMANKGHHAHFEWAEGNAPIWDYFQPVCKKCWDDCLHLDRFICNYEPKTEALLTLRALDTLGIELHLITSRPADVAPQTIDWANKHFPGIFKSTTVTFEKVQVAKELKLDAMLDDAPHNIQAFNEAKIDILIWDMPYNQGLPGIRIKSWDDLFNTVIYMAALNDKLDYIGRISGTGRRNNAYKRASKPTLGAV